MPDCYGDLAVNTRVHFLRPHAHTRLRVRLATGIPHALCFMGRRIHAPLGRIASRDRRAVPQSLLLPAKILGILPQNPDAF
jgi:hypothetical protein